MASIPHSTAALTDRGTAFNEGFAIHLETLAAHMATESELRQQYHHEAFVLSQSPARSEYLRRASDLANYAQTRSRYYEVREDTFAFKSAFTVPDYLRVQLDPARDSAALLSANQLLQSEGFYASFFFAFTVRGSEKPDEETIETRQARMFQALARMFAEVPEAPDSPYLLQFIETYTQLYANEAAEVVDVFNDLSHGVFVDPEAAQLWGDCYRAALGLDLATLRDPALWQRRARWREQVLQDPSVLYLRLGPQIPCTVEAVTVHLAALGSPRPLRFDVNTVQEGVLGLIPGLGEVEIERWLEEREHEPFAGMDDFRDRMQLSEEVLGQLAF